MILNIYMVHCLKYYLDFNRNQIGPWSWQYCWICWIQTTISIDNIPELLWIHCPFYNCYIMLEHYFPRLSFCLKQITSKILQNLMGFYKKFCLVYLHSFVPHGFKCIQICEPNTSNTLSTITFQVFFTIIKLSKCSAPRPFSWVSE